MSQPVIIEFRSSGLADVAKQFEKTGQAAKKAGDDAEKLSNKQRIVRIPAAPAPKDIQFAQGPNQRLSRLQMQHNQAVILGNANAQKDIEMAMQRTQKQIDNAKPKVPPSFGQKLGTAIASSRISSSGDIMPLVGQLAGLSEAAGPIGLLVTASVAAGSAIFKLASESSEAARQFAALSFATGSRGGTAGKLGGIGASIGLSSEDVGSLSASISERLRSDPFAMTTGVRMGIGPALPRPFDNVDEGARLLKVVEGLRSIKDFDERVRAARNLGAESLLPATNMSDRQFNFVKGNAQTQSQFFENPQFQQEASDFASSLSEVSKALGAAVAVAGRPAMIQLTDFFNEMAKNLNMLGTAISSIPMNKFKAFADVLLAMYEGRMGNIIGSVKTLKKAYDEFNDTSDDKNAAMDKNSNAVNANTEAIQKLTGTFGSPGDRFDGAIPAGLNNEYLRRALNDGGLRLPPF